jgi:S-adenosylmethionine synthetase
VTNDLFGNDSGGIGGFKDIRNQREAIAKQKAELLLQLGRLINKPPPGVVNGSIQVTRQWQKARAEAAKVAKSQRASVNDIKSAISKMEAFK